MAAMEAVGSSGERGTRRPPPQVLSNRHIKPIPGHPPTATAAIAGGHLRPLLNLCFLLLVVVLVDGMDARCSLVQLRLPLPCPRWPVSPAPAGEDEDGAWAPSTAARPNERRRTRGREREAVAPGGGCCA
ncbi:hypothetical protein SEVIR_8G073950v4 [Setaria viridis]